MCYITNMARTRPLIERTYRVVPLKDGTFAEDGTFVVEIAITGTWPTTTARAFATEAEAEAWIARHGGNSPPLDMLTPFSAKP
jgi:nitrous oxide reductase accessory protein NosL